MYIKKSFYMWETKTEKVSKKYLHVHHHFILRKIKHLVSTWIYVWLSIQQNHYTNSNINQLSLIFVSSFSYPAQHNLNISFLYEPKIWKSISQACLNLIKQKNNKLRYLYSMFEKNLISSGVIFQLEKINLRIYRKTATLMDIFGEYRKERQLLKPEGF